MVSPLLAGASQSTLISLVRDVSRGAVGGSGAPGFRPAEADHSPVPRAFVAATRTR